MIEMVQQIRGKIHGLGTIGERLIAIPTASHTEKKIFAIHITNKCLVQKGIYWYTEYTKDDTN